MTKIRVAINGFGRIGRIFCRQMINNQNMELVAINDITDTYTLCHLLKYDSVHKRFPGTVTHNDDYLHINDQAVKVTRIKNPEECMWK
jgi:glyceraldehyde 3-phosphate dehydrogenase